MSNGTIGSPANPTFSGWIEHGAGWQFACKVQSPAFDVYLTQIHCYFDTYQGNGAIGKMVVWQDGGGYPILEIIAQGIINNGTLTWGGQQWWSQPIGPPIFMPANTFFWIGCWCNQNIVVSTYDTNPQTFAMNSGSTSNPTAFSGAANTGQGPLGCYVEYSTVVYGNVAHLGGSGSDGLSGVIGHTTKPGSVALLGSQGGGIAAVNTDQPWLSDRHARWRGWPVRANTGHHRKQDQSLEAISGAM